MKPEQTIIEGIQSLTVGQVNEFANQVAIIFVIGFVATFVVLGAATYAIWLYEKKSKRKAK